MLETKLSRLLGVFYKTKSFLPNHVLKKLYYAFIHSHLTFGLLVWSATPKSNLSKLQRIQNKAICLLAGAAWRDHASPLYAQLNLLSLDKLVLLVLASFMHKYHLKKLPKIFDNQSTPDQLETLPNINNTLFLSLLLIYFNVISSFEAQKSGTAYPINLNNKLINSSKINS